MATYEVTDPNGKKWEITAPDSATEDQVMEYAKSQFSGGTQSQPAAKETSLIYGTDPVEELTRGTKSAVRGVVKGVTAIPAVMADAATGVYNTLTPQSWYKFPSTNVALENQLARFGLTPSDRPVERFGESAIAGMTAYPAKVTAALPAVTSAKQAFMQGGTMGALGGLTAPVDTPEERLKNALGGFAGGAIVGTGVRAAGSLTNWIGRRAGEAADLFRGEKGAKNIVNRFLRSEKAVGKEAIWDTVNAANAADDIIPGGAATMSQATVGKPGASPISAVERIVSKTGGGISDRFNARVEEQAQAVKNALKARTDVSKVNYARAYDPSRHQLKVDAELGGIANNPYFARAANSADVNDIYKARGLTPDRNLTEMLHEVKIELDKRIKATPLTNALNKTKQSELINIKTRLVNWLVKNNSDYKIGKNDYQQASQAIDSFLERQKAALKPPVTTNLAGGLNMAEASREHLPTLLYRPAMAANWLLRLKGSSIEPLVDKVAADMMLDPSLYGKEIAKLPREFQLDLAREAIRANALAFVGANALGQK